MNLLIAILQQVKIDEKLKEAPNDNYAIGVFIGTILPFLVLVFLAYMMYRYHKNRMKDE